MLETEREGIDADRGDEARHELVDNVGRALDEVRSRIDELLVRVDLASLDVRDELRVRINSAESAYLTARKRLGEARNDTSQDLRGLRRSLDQLLGDLRGALEGVERVVRQRTRS